GATAVIDAENQLLGIVTDGDLRRMLASGVTDYGALLARDLLSPAPKHIAPDALAVDALVLLREHSITQLVVLENGQYLGMVHLHDLVREGLI
ncbi:MAG: CBS domain-containing protein, partial [Saprospiraceae bacterium]